MRYFAILTCLLCTFALTSCASTKDTDRTAEPTVVQPATTATAAASKASDGRADRQTDEMTKQLGLDGDQADQLRDINRKYASQREALRDRRDQGNARDVMRRARQDQEREIMALLTQSQQATFNELKAERQRQNQARRGNGGRPGGGR